ncbi:MAG: sulfatase-like hydrolase/transferase [Acidobacteria bacterium]|nr:sulfatase-like hydrolase/transferase [Acidobacteriota bacterium]
MIATKDGEQTLLVTWPILFGFVLVLLRVIILATFGGRGLESIDFIGLLIGLAGQIAFGLLLVLPLHLLRASSFRWLIHLGTLLVVFVNVAAFHFEAVFGRLPGVDLLYYLREATHLLSSIAANAPLAAVALEVGVATAILILDAEALSRGNIEGKVAWRRRLLRVAAAICVVSAALTAVVHAFPSVVPSRMSSESRVPIFRAIQTWQLRSTVKMAGEDLQRADVLAFQRLLGHRAPFGGVDQRYPLCATTPRNPQRTGNDRSAILLVLESVGLEEMKMVHRGELVMPALNRIRSESVSFERFKASGSKSVQAMPALFAGVPPQPAQHLLWRRPLNNLDGFPRILKGKGYETSYFHGGDLSFEQQRTFLQMVGFEELFEYDVSAGHPFLGWGHSDDVTFAELRRWISGRREDGSTAPWFATLFTLTTHDPYILPPEREHVFEGEGDRARFIETLRFLDEQLGSFYEWFLENEAPRGTLLLVTSDHAPHLEGERHVEDHEVTRFDVPLLIHGEGLPAGRTFDRLGAHFDLPATLLGLLDLSPGPCDQGLDLLVPSSEWPDERIVYAVTGDNAEEFHVWFSDAAVRLDLITKRVSVQLYGEPAADDLDRHSRAAVGIWELASRISSHLTQSDGFAPAPRAARSEVSPIPPVARPRFVAHRGQSRGEEPPEKQNRIETIELAIADGFEWVEVDVNLTADGHLVLVHDTVIREAPGVMRAVSSMTLEELRGLPGYENVVTLEQVLAELGEKVNFLVEVKPQGSSLLENEKIALRASAVVARRTPGKEIVMDSFSPLIASTLARQCRCEVGIDASGDRPIDSRWVDEASRNGLSWLYVDHRRSSPELIRYAHEQGLRVLVYTVNSLAEIEHLRREWPDAIITDTAELMSAWETREAVSPSDAGSRGISEGSEEAQRRVRS